MCLLTNSNRFHLPSKILAFGQITAMHRTPIRQSMGCLPDTGGKIKWRDRAMAPCTATTVLCSNSSSISKLGVKEERGALVVNGRGSVIGSAEP